MSCAARHQHRAKIYNHYVEWTPDAKRELVALVTAARTLHHRTSAPP
jgi:hypothetical protein